MAMKRYEQIAEKMREAIVNGSYVPNGRLEPMRKLCSQFGVSVRTVRSAISIMEEDGLVTVLPRQGVQVCRDADQRVAGSVRKHSIMYVRWNLEPLCVHFSDGLLRAAAEHGHTPLIVDARRSHKRFLDSIKHPPQAVKGLLLMAFDLPEYGEAIAQAQKSGLKIVFLDRILSAFDFSSVTVDNFSGGYLATNHLISLHERPVYCLSFKDHPSCVHDRFCGWRNAMDEHGFGEWQKYFLEPRDEEGKSVELLQQEVKCLLRDLFDQKRAEKYCIFAMNDPWASAVYETAAQTGLTVGKDVFVVGFDDLPLCQRLDPPMSSVKPPKEDVAYQGAKLLYEELAGILSKPIHSVLPVELKVRASSTGIGCGEFKQISSSLVAPADAAM